MTDKGITLPDKQLLTVQEVAGLLSCGRSTVYAWIEEGKVEAVRFSNSVRITRRSLEAFLK